MPSAGDFVQEEKESSDGAGQIQRELRDIGPDYGAHPTLERVRDREPCHDGDGPPLASPERDAYDFADR